MSAIPPPYTRQASFTSFQTPDAPTTGVDLEAEFNKLDQVLDATQDRLAEIQRDDGRLKNLSVHVDALNTAVRALFAAEAGVVRGVWTATTAYAVKDVVTNDDITYLAVSAHTSGADFDVDLASGKWVSLSGDAAGVRFIQAGSGAIVRTMQDKAREIVSVKDFGAVGDGTTDDTAAFVAALATGKDVYIPAGTYRITSSITLPTKCRLFGAGVDRTIINSNIPGDSLFKAEASGASFIHVSHMRLNGNGIVGGGGSGHCFNFIDPAPSSGSNTPQVSRLENLWIDGFAGTDDADHNGVIKVNAAGVIQYDTLGVTCERVYISDCGHGFYMRKTQNCRILDCLVTDIQKAALFAYDNENLIVDHCDLIDSQKSGGTTDSGYPDGGVDTELAGVVVVVGGNNLVLANSKLKGFQGKALIVLKEDGIAPNSPQNIVIQGNWIRGDAQADQPHKAIYAVRIAGLAIRNNLFTPSNTGFSATRKYETIELYTPSSAPTFESTIEGNVFLDAAGFDTAYNIKITGNSTARTHRTKITGNRFGANSSRSSAMTVDNDVLVTSCLLEASEISGNSFYAPTNVTRTACIAVSGATLRKVTIGPNVFQASGGTITANYSGVAETESVSADKGNAAATLTPSISERVAVWNTPITADRAVTLATTGAASGDSFRIVRTAAATGAFNLNVGSGPLKALAAGQWCEVHFNGSAWALTAFGSL
jgi:hypothetical protein